jgi:glycosyltransferase involved in cell wall biosynthesis
VIPSECYENLPNTLLESFAFNKCVVATNIGSLAENIIHRRNGLLFQFRNAESLKDQISYLFNNPDAAKEMGRNAGTILKEKFSESIHYKKLITLFEKYKQTEII